MNALQIPDFVRAQDAADPLRGRRAQFILPEGVIYLDGNSLGPATYAGLAALEQASHGEWAQGLIRSWNDAAWVSLGQRLGAQIAPLIGAAADEVVVADSTSINCYKALHAACAMRPERSVIVAEAGSFPTDLYMAEGVVANLRDHRLRLEGRDAESIDDLINEHAAVVLVNHVDYRTGRLRDMAALNARIHAAGALSVWDLSHSAGALPVHLAADGADFAIGCGYKYLNGGPGAPAYIYAARRHHAGLQQPLSGWWGHARPFDFVPEYEPITGVGRLQVGTPSVLAMRTLEGALSVWDGVDLAQLRGKSLALAKLFIDTAEGASTDLGLRLASPRVDAERGSQVSFSHPDAYPVMQALIERGIIGDFRAPDLLRFGFAPLYLSYSEVWLAAQTLIDVLRSGLWRQERFARRAAAT